MESNGNDLQAYSDRYLCPMTSPEARLHYYDGVERADSRFNGLSNGERMGIVSVCGNPVAMTDFRFRDVIVERWGGGIFFVQDADTGKWGVYSMTYPRMKRRDIRHWLDNRIVGLKEILPTIADEIFEAELYTDCAPTTFWVARQGETIGIITRWKATGIIYDSFTGNDEDMEVTLFQNGFPAEKITSF